jgi:hypothetical protein
MSPSAGQLEKLAAKNRLVVKPHPTADERRDDWRKRSLNLAANMVVRSLLTYLGQKSGQLLGRAQASET